MPMSSCLSDEQLTPLAAGEVPAADVAEHLERLADCRRRLRRLQREIKTVRQVFGELTTGGYWLDSKDTLSPGSPSGSPSGSPPDVLALGTLQGHTLGRYVLLERIGRGGMGEVYKARDDRMGRVVAVKVLSHGAIISDETVARFRREVRAAAQLSHPNIVTAYDADEADGIHFLVMEYVDGTDLASMVKDRGPLPVAQAVDYVLQAAAALQYAHDQGIIHRDVKPSNLLVDRKNTVKVLDMGLARFDPRIAASVSLADGLTVAGQIMGSLDYLVPEQAVDPNTADRQADVYSLGCTLFYLLTGKPIYHGETVLKAVVAHREQSIPRLGQLRKDVPEAVESVFRKMVAKQPGQRPATMNDVIDALRAPAGPRREDERAECSSSRPSPSPARPSSPRSCSEWAGRTCSTSTARGMGPGSRETRSRRPATRSRTTRRLTRCIKKASTWWTSGRRS